MSMDRAVSLLVACLGSKKWARRDRTVVSRLVEVVMLEKGKLLY